MKFLSIMLFMLMSTAVLADGLTLAQARQLAARAQEHAASKGWRVSVTVVNSEGNLVLFERGDGSYTGSIEASRAKAESANAFQRSTGVFAASIKDRPGLATVKGIVAVEGGLPIVMNGVHMGAIGVSGARAIEDEEVATEALKVLVNR